MTKSINLKIDTKFFCRLPGYIVEIYSVTLIILFTGCTGDIIYYLFRKKKTRSDLSIKNNFNLILGAICLAMLMIQLELVQVLLLLFWTIFCLLSFLFALNFFIPLATQWFAGAIWIVFFGCLGIELLVIDKQIK